MAIYSDKVDQELKSFEGLWNNLLKYDNYTYHVQFFIVDKKTQKDYSRARFNNFTQTSASALDLTTECTREANKLLEGHKFVVAESGKTTDVSIVSLDIKSVPGFGTNDKTYAASVEFKLKIKEVAGNSLVNKIHLTTSMLGYRSYVNTPFFLSVWFSGYNNTNKEIAEYQIKDAFGKDVPVLTYQVIIEDVKTSVGEDTTTYDMTLRPITDLGLVQTFSSVHTFKARDIVPGDPIGSIFKMVENEKNKELKEAYKDGLYEAIYGTETPAFQIKTTDKMPNFKDINELFEIANIRPEIEDAPKQEEKVPEAKTETKDGKQAKDVKKTKVETPPQEEEDKIYVPKGATKEQMTKKFDDIGRWPMANCPFEPDTADNIPSILTEIFQICCPGLPYLPTYNFVPEYITEYKGISYYRVTLYVSYEEIAGLKDMIKNKKDRDLLEYALFGPKTIEEAQLHYLETVKKQGALLKKYRWLLNGVEESVLSYDTTEDLFWYLNAGDYAARLAKESTASINRENFEKEKKLADEKCELLMSKINNKLGANKDGIHADVNVSDITYMVDAKTAELMDATFIRGAEANDLYVAYQRKISSDKKDKENKDDDIERLKINASIQDSKIGAQNMLSHGQKSELKLKIIGDPYWLTFMSENIQIAQRSLPHLIMDIKTYTKFDGMDDPKEDELMRMITVYRITDIDSHFEEGKFTQDLHGFVATPFVSGYNPTFYKKVGVIENMFDGDLHTATIIKDSNGEVHIIKNDDVKEKDNTKSTYLKKKNQPGNSSTDKKYRATLDDGSIYTFDKLEEINSDMVKDIKI